MISVKLTASSSESMAAAMASAVSQAEGVSNDAVKINIVPISFIEDDGEYRVIVIIDVFEVADLSEEELAEIEGRKAAFKGDKDELVEEFDEEATGVVKSDVDIKPGDLAEEALAAAIVMEPKIIKLEPEQRNDEERTPDEPIIALESNIGEMELKTGLGWDAENMDARDVIVAPQMQEASNETEGATEDKPDPEKPSPSESKEEQLKKKRKEKLNQEDPPDLVNS